MEYTQEPIPEIRSERSIGMHGPNTPFRHWKVMRDYIAGILHRNHYEDLISYNTTVEHVEKTGDEWKVVLRKEGKTCKFGVCDKRVRRNREKEKDVESFCR